MLKKLLRKWWLACGSIVKPTALVDFFIALPTIFLMLNNHVLLGNQNLETEERLPIWYILDEFGYADSYYSNEILISRIFL